ncbi:MAG TPA: hypothetical protein VES38_07600 [Methylotenera sp.]|nr:hypothetical protein [Methylotenera sp.]
MTMRKNKVLEQVVKKGVEMSRDKHNLSAIKMMTKAGVPYVIVDRVLYEPHNVRSTD